MLLSKDNSDIIKYLKDLESEGKNLKMEILKIGVNLVNLLDGIVQFNYLKKDIKKLFNYSIISITFPFDQLCCCGKTRVWCSSAKKRCLLLRFSFVRELMKSHTIAATRRSTLVKVFDCEAS